jgi:hypothetical protein
MLSDNWTANSIVIFGVMNRTTIRFEDSEDLIER